MAQITFTDANGNQHQGDAAVGDSILEVAQANDINLDHACGGNGVCTTCMVKVGSGEENLNSVTDAEDMMGIAGDPGMRLGCQSRLEKDGPVSVEIMF